MPLVRIDTLDDPRLDPYRHLKHTNATRRTGQFVVEGDKLTERLLESGWPVLSVLVDDAHLDWLRPQVSADIPVWVVPRELVEPLVGFNFHRGVLAIGERPVRRTLTEAVDLQRDPLLVVVCPQVHDPQNLGAILRNAAALGAHAALLGTDGADPFSRRVLRVSMGAVFQLPVVVSGDLGGELTRLRAAGLATIATVLDPAAEPLDRFTPPHRSAWLFGSEGHGLGDAWLSQCDHWVTIPMPRGIDSLNVAVASGIFLYHATRPWR